MFLDSDLNREVTNGNLTSKMLGKLCPALRDDFRFLGYVMTLAFISLPVARETTLDIQGHRQVQSVYASLLAYFPDDLYLE